MANWSYHVSLDPLKVQKLHTLYSAPSYAAVGTNWLRYLSDIVRVAYNNQILVQTFLIQLKNDY